MYPLKGRTLLVLLYFMILTISHTTCHARKLQEKKAISYTPSLVLSALPKGGSKTPSSPSKGHSSAATTTTLSDHKLFGRHLAANNRILDYSVPSPGVSWSLIFLLQYFCIAYLFFSYLNHLKFCTDHGLIE